MDLLKIGLYLKQLRTQKQLTQSQLADYLGVSSRTISRWETGRNLPDMDLLLEMADFYEVDIRDLMEGSPRVDSQPEKPKEPPVPETGLKEQDDSPAEPEEVILDKNKEKDRNQTMNTRNEVNSAVAQAAEYEQELRKKMYRQLHAWCWIGLSAMLGFMLIDVLVENTSTPFWDFSEGCLMGIITGVMLFGLIATSSKGVSIMQAKRRMLRRG